MVFSDMILESNIGKIVPNNPEISFHCGDDVPQQFPKDEDRWIHRQVDKTWMVKFPHKTDTGEIKWITRRGFVTKQEAVQWVQDFKLRKTISRDMLFWDLVQDFYKDKGPHFRQSIFVAKKNIIETMLLPYLGQMRLYDITGADILQWQNEIMRWVDPKTGKTISRSYFRTVNRQLSEVFDHAVRFYGLPKNPAKSVAKICQATENETRFRSSKDPQSFAECLLKNPLAYSCFETLYWSGIREGEVLALTRRDIDLKGKTIYVSKTLQGTNGGDITAVSKPLMTVRRMKITDALCEELRDYLRAQGRSKRSARLFPATKELSLAEG